MFFFLQSGTQVQSQVGEKTNDDSCFQMRGRRSFKLVMLHSCQSKNNLRTLNSLTELSLAGLSVN